MLYTGAIKDQKDERDYIYEALGAPTMTQEEWEEGFDIEDIVGKLWIKDQKSSYSCVGQAFSYYKEVLDRLKDEQSAKAIYSQIFIGYNQGAYLRDGAKLIKSWGSVKETLVPSHLNGIVNEMWMTDRSWYNEEITKIAKENRTEDYFMISGYSIDTFARAIKDHKGVVMGVTGTNNSTWTSLYPVVPSKNTPNADLWGHALYAGKFRLRNGKKEIGVKNSWGDIGENGWQWLGEEWFGDDGRWVFNPWIMINKAKLNDMNNSKILKDKNSSAVGIWLPAISEDVLKSYCLNMGKEVPMKDGHVDWEKIIDGEIEFK